TVGSVIGGGRRGAACLASGSPGRPSIGASHRRHRCAPPSKLLHAGTAAAARPPPGSPAVGGPWSTRSIEPVVERYLPKAPHAKPPVTGAADARGTQPGVLRYCLGRPYLGAALQVRQNVVHEAVLLCFFGGEELVPLDIAADLLLVPAAVPGDDALHRTAHPQDLPGLDLQVTGLPVAAFGGRLVQQDAGVRQRHPLVLGARGQQH